jgi:hypothetical protein
MKPDLWLPDAPMPGGHLFESLIGEILAQEEKPHQSFGALSSLIPPPSHRPTKRGVS